MDRTLTLILLISIPFEAVQQKFQDFCNLERNEFSPNLKGVAQKLGPPRPFEVFDVFGRKSKSEAPNAFKFGPKRVPIEVNNWWKIGVDISNHFWQIQKWKFCLSNSFPKAYEKILFEKEFIYCWEGIWKTKCSISNWKFEIPHFVKNLGSRCPKFGYPAKSVYNFRLAWQP